jgi:protein SERAC1
VFVHGLTGNRENTWTYRNGSQKVFWPRDLLSKTLPRARIATFGYDADVVRMWRVAGSNGLLDHGNSLAYAAVALRQTIDAQTRAIIFVAHSLGGLVCEQALLVSNMAGAVTRLRSVAESTRGIVFMGTPHRGSDLASWGNNLAKYLSRFRSVNRKLVKTLEVDSDILRAVEEDFQKMILKPEYLTKINVFCFYEEIGMTGFGKIVPKDSAILPQYPNASIHANHRGMTQFKGANDSGYVAVSSLLSDWADNLKLPVKAIDNGNRTPTPAASADHALPDQQTESLTPPIQTYNSMQMTNTINGNISSEKGHQFVNSTFNGLNMTFTFGPN